MMAWLSAGHGNLYFSSSERVDGPLTSSDLQPFQGPLPLSSFLMLGTVVFIPPPLHCMVWLRAGYSSPLGQETFFSLCFPFTTIFFYFTLVSTFILFLPFPSFSFIIIIFQFFSNFFFPALPLLLWHFLSCPSLP
jgi:hypothetical protein